FRFGPFNTAMCTSAVPTCRDGTSGSRAQARPVGPALGLEAPEPGLELIEVALILHRRPEPAAGAPRRRLHRWATLAARRGCAPRARRAPRAPRGPRARRFGRA